MNSCKHVAKAQFAFLLNLLNLIYYYLASANSHGGHECHGNIYR